MSKDCKYNGIKTDVFLPKKEKNFKFQKPALTDLEQLLDGLNFCLCVNSAKYFAR